MDNLDNYLGTNVIRIVANYCEWLVWEERLEVEFEEIGLDDCAFEGGEVGLEEVEAGCVKLDDVERVG